MGKSLQIDSWNKIVTISKPISTTENYFLSNNIAKPIEIISKNELENNLIRYVILRNPHFSKELKNFLQNNKSSSIPQFCANLYAEILDQVWPQTTKDWDQIDRNHTETIFKYLE